MYRCYFSSVATLLFIVIGRHKKEENPLSSLAGPLRTDECYYP